MMPKFKTGHEREMYQRLLATGADLI